MLKMDGIIRETKTGTKGLNGSANSFGNYVSYSEADNAILECI